jgi:sporulation protein YlmC with PRC-barrel domain
MKKAIPALAALMLLAAPVYAQQQGTINFLSQQTQNEVLGTDFIGTPVKTKDGQQIGKISNLVFDQEGRIENAVIGVGGFLGVGAKEVAVPFDSLKSEVDNNKHVMVIDATKEQLNAAPSYKTLNDQAFNQRVANWRAKAEESWAKLKQRAGEAYDSAKTRINEARQGSDKPAQ